MEKDELLELGIDEEAAEKIAAESARMKAEYEKSIENLKRENEIEMLLAASGARNTRAVKALLNTEEGNFEQQIEKLKSDAETRFLFEKRKSFAPARSGERLPEAAKDDFVQRLAQARKNKNALEAIKIKQQAANEGIVLM